MQVQNKNHNCYIHTTQVPLLCLPIKSSAQFHQRRNGATALVSSAILFSSSYTIVVQSALPSYVYDRTVRFAPPPDDIYWENLTADNYRLFLIKAVFINLVLFLVLFFFTSPAYIISQLELILNFKSFTPSEKINDFIPTLMLWTLSALLPIVVAFSDWWMGHWRRSVENQWIFRKVFFYLLFMVLILPSIGLTSLRAAFEIVFQDQKKTEVTFFTSKRITK